MSGARSAPPARLELWLAPGQRSASPIEVAPGGAWLVDDAPEAVVATLLGTGPRRSGWARLDGRPLRGSLASRVRRGLGVVQDAPVAPSVPVRDHLAARVGAAAADRALADAPLLAGRGDDPAGVLSGGERTVLAWLRALITDPTVLLLVRAGAGLDGATLAWAGEQVQAQRARGVSVVVVPGRVEEHAWAPPETDPS